MKEGDFMFYINGKEFYEIRYANGELDMRKFKDTLNNSCVKEGKKVKISWYYRNDDELTTLRFIKKYLDTLKCKVNITIKYLPYSRMDKEEESPFILKYICEYINELKFNKVIVVEPHSNVPMGLLDNAESYLVNETLIEDVMKKVNFNINDDYLMFPNIDAQKRYNDFKYNNILGNNVKTSDEVELIGNMVYGCKVIIVDDLVSYGNDIVKYAKLLKESGASEVYFLVAHSDNDVYNGDLLKIRELDKVFTTNTILTKHLSAANRKMYKEVLYVYNI